MKVNKSNKLMNVCYDIRGPVMKEATRLEEEGFRIIKLNIGNTAPFGLMAPEEIIRDVVVNINNAQGYSESKGIFPARKAIMQYCQERGIPDVTINDIYLGNGVSELIVMSMQALLNPGDEMLVPMPDYPLWTAAINLSTGKAVHYLCDESSDWVPDIEDIKKKITDKTKGIVIINPNNPTGANYPKEILLSIIKLARENNLILFADEIYDKILYDGEVHHSVAALAQDHFTVTFNGLSKTYRVPGFRAGWMILSGEKSIAKDYIEGLEMLSSMRLCSNVPAQYAIPTSLGGYQSVKDLTKPGGRLFEQRNLMYEELIKIPGITCVKPKGALYLFPKIDTKKFSINSDQKFILDFLLKEKVLIVQGTGFNWKDPDHFRFVFLPPPEQIQEAINRLRRFLLTYKQE